MKKAFPAKHPGNCTSKSVSIRVLLRSINQPPGNVNEYQATVSNLAMTVCTRHWIREHLENVDILKRGLIFTSRLLVAEEVEIAKHPSVHRIA
ncbi:hypothetical protein T265_11793 [Opisthorchis viverrini]|uniref:Uncharacterized protein n=1 Tax=Opisthorchis viverrini TaxID=6198 RepID=A0A074YXN8_OPIVI|nr:hypothetical protein T265_11793 [Opisthorchis viverrini]KER19433.1 hypothetical protein T265_11793 [Opisthorchis viverrini]